MTPKSLKYVDQERHDNFSCKRENTRKSMEIPTLWNYFWFLDCITTWEGGGMKTVLYVVRLDIGSYSTDLLTGVLPYYKLVKDHVEKISKNSSSSTRFIFLIFSTRYLFFYEVFN